MLKLNADTVEKSFVDKCWVAEVAMLAGVLNNTTVPTVAASLAN